MIKAHLLAGMIAVMSMGAMSSLQSVSSISRTSKERDSRIIVEVKQGLEGLSEDEITKSQEKVLKSIRTRVTSNIELIRSYNLVANAFAIEINSADIEAVKALPDVASITIDKVHAYKAIGSGNTYSARKNGSASVAAVEENISATTMHKPVDTNDGAGTVIAILDNEFFFRGKHTHNEDCSFAKFYVDPDADPKVSICDGNPIGHEVYSPLDSDVPVRFTFSNMTELLTKTKAKRKNGAVAGEEGSLYYNNKVPFYYDYGGESTSYGKEGKMDYDVSSILAYHGSHVASIAAANAPTYAGIAPKAQLACMKVFTNYKADDVAKNLGFGDSSGAYDICILSALEDCIALGVDGINMSLGSDLDDFDQDSISLKTLKKLAEKGIMSAISAGNSGKASYSFTGAYGNWTTDMVETGILGSYANSEQSTIVASGQPTEIFFKRGLKLGTKNVAYEDQIVNREGLDAEYTEEFKLEDLGDHKDYVYIGGFGQQSDYVGKEVEGKIVITNRGSISFADKYANAANNGAVALIVINNDPTATDFNFRMSFGDGFNPTMPCALVLFKDKPIFEAQPSGTYDLIKDETSANDQAYTMSSFSTDGARFNYDLKPDITTPGDIIKGAVPPQTKEHKYTPLASYEYLSGTSMSSPNYAGAQSVVLSKVAKEFAAKTSPTAEEKAAYEAFRKTVDMRLMSTAVPMNDFLPNPEAGLALPNYTSPRLQGAGMVNLGRAYNTNVYLEGLAKDGETGIGKSKIVLGNSGDIAKGDLKLSFLAHNESENAANYNVKLTVMRPAIKKDNVLPTREYNYRTEISDVKYLPGISYYDQYSGRQLSSSGQASYKDVFKLSQDIEYYANEEAYLSDTKTVMAKGNWYVKSQGKNQKANIVYDVLPDYEYQSTQDIVLAEVTGQVVSLPASSKTKVTIDTYSLTAEQKADIAKYYPYGCAIEGFVELLSTGTEPDLSIPYLGFYAGEKTYKDAPVAEPFSFEKRADTIYPSDLVNNLGKTLLGKDNGNMESLWVVGYSENPANINTDKVLSNDTSLDRLSGFHRIGTDPLTGQQVDGKFHVGNPSKTNTMLIQQFILRSVNDNFFTITRKADGKIVYKSVLEDMLYGDQYGRYPLYKSHVDGGFLGAGYIAHRAYAAIPLFDPETNVPFDSGEYEITFNYQLVGCNNEWVSKSYEFVVDSASPEFVGAVPMKDEFDEDVVRFEFKDMQLSYGVLGYQLINAQYDSEKEVYYMEALKEDVLAAIEEIGPSASGQKRLYLKAIDTAYGETGVIIHFTDENDLSKIEAIAAEGLQVNMDFTHGEHEVTLFEIDELGNETIIALSNYKTIGFVITPEEKPDEPTKNNLGLILGLSIGGGVLVLGGVGVALYFLVFKKKIGAKKAGGAK